MSSYNIPPVRVPHGRKTPEDTLRIIERRAERYATHNGQNYQEVLARFKLAYSQFLTLPED